MQMFRTIEQDATLVGWGARVLFLAEPGAPLAEVTAKRLAGMGGLIEWQEEIYSAMAGLIDDPTAFGLFVIECDSFGGLDAVLRNINLLRSSGVSVPVILISGDCTTQVFPEEHGVPIQLRAPASSVSLRVGFEHALRERLLLRAA